jgi:TfoX/Sxy family transcriptional regulator of competence genes
VSPEERYAALVETFLHGDSGATPSTRRGFGSDALWIRGSIFAMLSRGRLVVKLPRQRVDALVASGDGERFDPGHGRLMKDWLSVGPGLDDRWLDLAREALEFVASKR